jgi:hypothetical protein
VASFGVETPFASRAALKTSNARRRICSSGASGQRPISRAEERAMSQSNVETIQQVYAAFGRGDVPAILERVSDDTTWSFNATDSKRALAQDHARQG